MVLLTIVFVSCSGKASQGNDGDRQRINKECDMVMQSLAAGKSKDGIRRLKAISVLGPDNLDTLGMTIESQLSELMPAYGSITGFKFIKEYTVKDIIARRNYILMFERYYLRFSFTVYKTPGGWMVTNFDYNDSLIEVLF